MSLCVRACACVCDREMERERETCAHFEECSFFFLLFFCTSHRKESTFSCLWFPLTQQKVLLFFVPFFVSLLSFSPALPFLFFDLPYKKNHHSKKKEGSFFVVLFFFFFCLCFFLSLTTEQHKKGIAKYLCAKAKKATLIFLGFAQKAPKKKRFSQNVTCSPLSRVSL